MSNSVAQPMKVRHGVSLLALIVATGSGAQALAQTRPPAPLATPTADDTGDKRAPGHTASGTAPTQTAPVAGLGIAISTVPDNERIAAPDPAPVAVSAAEPAAQTGTADEEAILVVGVRQAEQSAIQRKRTARTAQDSIVADDVGQFPDKNAAEAIARIAGVALDVSDAGQQGGFTIRGQSADLIRVEVDGMTALPSNGDQGGRAVSIADISSDLIKSVDVVKGQTADMTPGGVGGTVRIEQRTGLDFVKPLYRLNVQGRLDTINGRLSPRINAIATQKLFDGRLGLLFNGTYEEQRLTTDFARVSQRQQGYLPLGDYDNSPDKSFTTPFDPAAAAITTKAGCAALPTTGINSRLNCYAQWEDFVPSLPRYGRGVRTDKRYSFQLRADWQTTDNLTLFASYNPNIRKYDSQDYNLSVATPAGTTGTNGLLATSNITNVVVNPNHYVTQFDMVRGTGIGRVASLNWSSQVRDIQTDSQQHYAQAGADWNVGSWTVKARGQYSYSKSDRQDEAFTFNAALPSATFNLVPENGLWNISTPDGIDLSSPAAYYPVLGVGGISAGSQLEYTPQADRNSEWNYQLDVTRDFENLGPLTRIKFGGQYRSRDNESYREGGSAISPGVIQSRARSLDLVQFCSPAAAPATAPCQFGSTRRTITAGTTDQLYKIHTLTEAQYQEVIGASLQQIPGKNFFSGLPDRGDLLGSWTAFDAKTFLNTLGQYADLSDHNLDCLFECVASDGQVYTRPSFSTNEKTLSAYAMVDFSTDAWGVRVDGNVGVRYQRIDVDASPVVNFARRSAVANTTGLPGFTIQDIFVSRTVGQVQRTSEDWLPSFNLALWPVEDKLGLRYSIALQRARPSILQLTGNGAVTCGIVSAEDRAALEQFLINNPGAIDDGDPGTGDDAEAGGLLTSFINRCSGRIGNPELKGYGALTQNLSLEWYPNRDSQLTAAVYSINVRTGRPENISLANYGLEGNSYEVATFRDGPGGLTTRGFEVAGRTAFTFLPWIFKYTGGGFNYSYSKSNESNTAVDLFTGTALPPRGQSSYYYNVNAWYDDGRLNARIAYQARSQYYDRTESDGGNRIPTGYNIDGGSTGAYFKTVSPIFKTSVKTLDGRAAYKLTDGFQLFVEGKNLTDASYSRFTPSEFREIGDGTPYIFDTYFSGRTYYFGVIATF